jgi:DnaJ family protein A protein 5
MLKEDKELQFDDFAPPRSSYPVVDEDEDVGASDEDERLESEDDSTRVSGDRGKTPSENNEKDADSECSEDEQLEANDDPDLLSLAVTGKLNDIAQEVRNATDTVDEDRPQLVERGAPKKLKGKKAKEARKKARSEQQEARASGQAQICNVCHESFDTRNKLFGHVKESGHALAEDINVLGLSAQELEKKRKPKKKGKK